MAGTHFEGTARGAPSPRTLRFEMPQGVRTEWKTQELRAKCGVVQPDRCQSLQSTKVVYRIAIPIRPQGERTADSQCATVLDKTHVELSSDVRGQRQLARFAEKIEFYLLRESRFRFLRI